MSPECKKCMESGLCKKKAGLPILLTRYAVGFKDSAPKLSGKFKVEESIELGKGGMYTQRLIRSGYLYVVDNKDRWQGYFVTNDAFLIPLPVPSSASDPDFDASKKPCQAFNYAMAGMLTIPNPDQVETIWIAFSDVAWSEDVWERYKDKGYRTHMRQFNVKKWCSGDFAFNDHAGKIGELGKHVTDFAEGVKLENFRFNDRHPSRSRIHPFPLLGRCGTSFWRTSDPDKPFVSIEEFQKLEEDEKSSISGLKKEDGSKNWPIPAGADEQIIAACERVLPGMGVIIALDDPAGITADISELVGAHSDGFENNKEYSRKLAASRNIVSLRTAIHNSVQGEFDTKIAIFESQVNYRKSKGRNPPEMTLENEEVKKVFREWLRYEQEDAWNKYEYVDYNKGFLTTPRTKFRSQFDQKLHGKNVVVEKPSAPKRIDEEARVAFIKEFNKKRAEFEIEIIKPLAEAHALWLESKSLANHFIRNASTKDSAQSGPFVGLLSWVIGMMSNHSPTKKILLKWMDGKLTDKENLLLRCSVLNQDSLCESVEKLSGRMEEVKAKYKSLLAEMERKASGADADKIISPEDRSKLKDFEGTFTASFAEAFKDFGKVISNAYAIEPPDPKKYDALNKPLPEVPPPPKASPLPKAPAPLPAFAPLPEVTPFNTLFAQILNPMVEHLNSLPPGKNSMFSLALDAHEGTKHADFVIEGTKKTLAEKTARSIGRKADMPGGMEAKGRMGLRPTVRIQIDALFPNTPDTERIAIRVRVDVGAFAGVYDTPDLTNRHAADCMRMAIGTMEFKATALGDIDGIHKLTTRQNILTLVRATVEAEKAEKIQRQADAVKAEQERLAAAEAERKRLTAEAQKKAGEQHKAQVDARETEIAARKKAVETHGRAVDEHKRAVDAETRRIQAAEAARENAISERKQAELKQQQLRLELEAEQHRNNIKTVQGDRVAGVHSAVGLGLSVLSLHCIWKRLAVKPDWDNPLDIGTRFTVALASTVGSLADITARTISAAEDYAKSNKVRQYAKGFNAQAGAKLLWAAKWFGIGASAGAFFIDVSDAFKAGSEGSYLMFGLHGVSAGVGAYAAYYQFLTRAPKIHVVYALLIATFAINQVIVHMKGDDLQQYLNRCAFSNITGKNGKANWTAEQEERQFEKASKL